MLNDIKSKLNIELGKSIKTEPQVIYILSRIRKILEVDKKEGNYRKLKFYCDWALHSQIDNTKPISEVLGKVVAEPENASDFFNYRPLDDELKKFFIEYNLSSTIYDTDDSQRIFKEVLTGIYSDTPLVIKQIKKTRVSIHKVTIKNTHEIGFTVKEE